MARLKYILQIVFIVTIGLMLPVTFAYSKNTHYGGMENELIEFYKKQNVDIEIEPSGSRDADIIGKGKDGKLAGVKAMIEKWGQTFKLHLSGALDMIYRMITKMNNEGLTPNKAKEIYENLKSHLTDKYDKIISLEHEDEPNLIKNFVSRLL